MKTGLPSYPNPWLRPGNWVASILHNPFPGLVKMLPEFRRLKDNMKRSRDNAEQPLDEIVTFFNYISIWHDRVEELENLIQAFQKANYGQFNDIINLLETLRIHIDRSGRAEFGWNRTVKGQIVTPEKVFLGNINGLFTKPVSFWKLQKDEPKGGWGFPGKEKLNAYDVVSVQAMDFMSSHIFPIIKLIDELEKYTA